MATNDSASTATQILGELAASDYEFERLLELVCLHACELTGADAGVIELVEDGEAVAAACSGRRPATVGSGAGMAIRHADDVAGVLRVEAAATRRFTPDHFEALRMLAEVVAVRLSTGTVATASRTRDPLTGLPNRRMFAERLAVESARARRHGQPLALCVFEVTGLAEVNDKLGHAAGDEVLRRVAATLHGGRLSDESFRLGGDQFALLMPQTELEGARAAGARLGAAVVAAGLSEGRVGINFGAAETHGDPVELHEDAAERLRLARRRRAASRPRRAGAATPRIVAVVRGRPLADAL